MGGLGSLEQHGSNYHHCHLKLQIELGSKPEFKEKNTLKKSFLSEILSYQNDPDQMLSSTP